MSEMLMRERLKLCLNRLGSFDVMQMEQVAAFVESEIYLALQQREQSPGLAEAEEWLDIERTRLGRKSSEPAAIANELDRLRALVQSLGGET